MEWQLFGTWSGKTPKSLLLEYAVSHKYGSQKLQLPKPIYSHVQLESGGEFLVKASYPPPWNALIPLIPLISLIPHEALV